MVHTSGTAASCEIKSKGDFHPPAPWEPRRLCPQPAALEGDLTSSCCSFNALLFLFFFSFFLLCPWRSWSCSLMNRSLTSNRIEKHCQILFGPLENTKAGSIHATEKIFSKTFSSRLHLPSASCSLRILSLCSSNSPGLSIPALAISCLLHLSLLTFHIYSFYLSGVNLCSLQNTYIKQVFDLSFFPYHYTQGCQPCLAKR